MLVGDDNKHCPDVRTQRSCSDHSHRRRRETSMAVEDDVKPRISTLTEPLRYMSMFVGDDGEHSPKLRTHRWKLGLRVSETTLNIVARWRQR